MTLYIDSSVLLAAYLDQPKKSASEELMDADRAWVTARHTRVEVRRRLATELDGRSLAVARREFESDWGRMRVLELDPTTCELAVGVAERTHARTLDALHLAAAQRIGERFAFLTFDRKQAAAARGMGFDVIGV